MRQGGRDGAAWFSEAESAPWATMKRLQQGRERWVGGGGWMGLGGRAVQLSEDEAAPWTTMTALQQAGRGSEQIGRAHV